MRILYQQEICIYCINIPYENKISHCKQTQCTSKFSRTVLQTKIFGKANQTKKNKAKQHAKTTSRKKSKHQHAFIEFQISNVDMLIFLWQQNQIAKKKISNKIQHYYTKNIKYYINKHLRQIFITINQP